MNYRLEHIEELEAEAIYIIRESFAQFENPCILFSGGKDSIVVTHLAVKAFYPAKIPFPLVHIDTGHNFNETISFRDDLVKKIGAQLIVGSVQEAIDKGLTQDEKGFNATRNTAQIPTLLDTLEKNKFDAAMGGARRDEGKARAKERIFSHRDDFGQWDPKINVQNYGTYLTEKRNLVSIFEFFQLVTGQKWIFGTTLRKRILICLVFTFHMKERLFEEETRYWPIHLI